jgi:hypothetical protein
MSWPPAASDFYLPANPHRAVFQGDVFEDIPFLRIGAGDTADADPKLKFEKRHVAPTLYPCDMVGKDGVTLIKLQPVVMVYDALSKDLRVPDDWDGALGVCPMPDLNGDGRLWVADFRTASVVPRQSLVLEKRVRCLSETGWAVFRQRLVGAATRALADLDDFYEVGAATWKESVYETRWVEAGRAALDFQSWLDDETVYVPGVYATLREALHDGQWEIVERALDDEIG